MKAITCDLCNSQIPLIPDGQMRFCACKCLGVDHTPEYTRYTGSIPREHPDFNQWAEKNKDTIDRIKNFRRIASGSAVLRYEP